MDIRRLLGRLYPGRAGSAELSQQDIAAAVGMIPSKLAREVLLACWWPEGSQLSRPKLLEMLGILQFKELVRQRKHFEEHALAALIEAKQADEPETDPDVARALRRVERAKSELWFGRMTVEMSDFVTLKKIRDAVLKEIAAPNQCKTCGGRMHVIRATRMLKCRRCDGRGTMPISNRARAALIDVDESTFRRQLMPVYLSMYTIVRDAEASAVAKMILILEPVCRGKAFRNGAYVAPADRGKRGVDAPHANVPS